MNEPKEILAVRIPPALKRQVEQAAHKEDRTVPVWVRRLLEYGVKKGVSK